MNTFLIIHNEIFDLQLFESSVKCPYVVLNNIDNSFDYSLLTNISTLGLVWVNNNRYMPFFNREHNYFPSSFENFINNIKNNYPLITAIDLITCNINTIEHINTINELSNKYNIIIRYSVNETNNQDWILESHNIDIKNIYFNENINNWNYSLDLGYHNAIVMSNGTVRTFGRNNYGQLGNGTTSSGATSNPVSVSNITSGAIAVSIGNNHTAVLMSNGTVKAFGRGDYGQLGNNSTTLNNTVPVDVLNISTAIAVSCGDNHTAVLLSNGTVKTFGRNNYGQLGDQSTTQRNTPVDVFGITTAIAIACGSEHTAILLSNGTVKTFGYNFFGQLGNGTNNNNITSTPVDVLGNITTAVGISCGAYHTVVLLSNGTVKTFGKNSDGQLGNGNYSNSNIPVDVIGINNCIEICCGDSHTMFLLSNGKIKIVGLNSFGLLGIGNSDINYRINSPITIPNINNAIAINCSFFSNTILLSDRTIRTFGYNFYGQLGDGTTTDRSTPVTINTSSMTGLTISNIIGYTQTVAIKGYIYNKKLSMFNDINLNNPFNITNNSSGNAFNLTNTSSGIGINITNTGSGNVLDISNNGTGFGLNINNVGTNITANIRKETGSTSNVLINTVSGSGNVLDISNNGTGTTLNISNNGTGDCLRIADQTSDTTLFRIDADGRVGVGVSTSDTLSNMFEIKGISTTSGNLINLSMNNMIQTGINIEKTNANSKMLRLSNNGGSGPLMEIINQASTQTGNSIRIEHNSTQEAIYVLNNGSSDRIRLANSANTEFFRVDNNGNVGIGVSSSSISNRLQVSGSANITQNLDVSGTLNIGSTTGGTIKFVPGNTSDPGPTITYRTIPAGQGEATEKTELILFNGNDNSTNSAGPDTITLRAPFIRLQTYNDSTINDISNASGSNDRLTIDPSGVVRITSTGSSTEEGSLIITNSVSAGNSQSPNLLIYANRGNGIQIYKDNGTFEALYISDNRSGAANSSNYSVRIVRNNNKNYPAVRIEGMVEIDSAGATNNGIDRGMYYEVGGAWGRTSSSGGRMIALQITNGVISMGTSYYIGTSDNRIKKNIRELNDYESYNIVKNINISKYDYIDYIKKPEKDIIGFIAQNIKENIPTAVEETTDYIPNIYKLLNIEILNNKKFNITIPSDTNLSDLSGNNQEIKFYDYSNNEYIGFISNKEYNILTIDLSNNNINDLNIFNNKLFVFGVKVNNLLNLNKDRIFAVFASATQQLIKDKEVLETKVNALEETIQNQQQQIQNLQNQINQILLRLN